jgi:16S rRNA processing protein RimM
VTQGADREDRRAPTGSEAVGELLAVGLVSRAHGIRGEVSVQPLSEVESRFQTGSTVLLGPDGNRRLAVATARKHGHRLLVKFEDVDDRDAAESLRGRVLLVPQGDAPPLPEDQYWVHEVVGIEVLTQAGRSVGTIREVLHNKANDVWLVQSGDQEVLIPALRDVVVEVDPAARRAVIREVPGLLGDDS